MNITNDDETVNNIDIEDIDIDNQELNLDDDFDDIIFEYNTPEFKKNIRFAELNPKDWDKFISENQLKIHEILSIDTVSNVNELEAFEECIIYQLGLLDNWHQCLNTKNLKNH